MTRNNNNIILPYSLIRQDDLRNVGVKSFKLAELSLLGDIPIIPGFVLTRGFFEMQLERSGIRNWAESVTGAAPGEFPLVSQGLRDRLMETPVAEDFMEEVFDSVRRVAEEHALPPFSRFVVRASPYNAVEELNELEGLHESFGCTMSVLELTIRRVLASFFLDRSLTYLASHRMLSSACLPILITWLPPHSVAGVCSSWDEVSGSADHFHIDLTFGFLNSITRGRVSPQTFRVEKKSGQITGKEGGVFPEIRVFDESIGTSKWTPLPGEYSGEQPSDVLAISAEELVDTFRRCIDAIHRAKQRERCVLEFCIASNRTIFVTDVKYYDQHGEQ